MENNKIRAFSAWDRTEKILGIVMIFQIIFAFGCNLIYMPRLIDGDFAMLATHIREMAENGTAVIADWKYTTTAEWDSAVLFALPLYIITHKIYLSLSLSNLIISILYVLACFLIFEKNRKAALICVNLLLIPYEFGMLSYFNMLFYGGSQYGIKVLIPILLIGVSLRMTEYSEEKKNVLTSKVLIPTIFVLFLIFLTAASSGIYVCMCGVFPAAATYIVMQFDRRGKLPISWIVTACLGMLLTGLGLIANKRIMGGTRADSLTFVTFNQYADGYLIKMVCGFFSVFGASTTNSNISVTSLYGAFFFLRIIFVLILICAVVFSVKKLFAHPSLSDACLLSIFIWNTLIVIITDVTAGSPTFESRYLLIGAVPALILFAERISELFGMREKRRRTATVFVYFSALLIMLIGTYRNIICLEAWEGDPFSDYRELVSECNTRSIDKVYIYDRSLETFVCTLLTENTVFLDVLPNGEIYVNDYYDYYEGPLPEGECYVAVPEVSAVFEDGEPIFGRKADCILSIGSIKLYKLA